MSEFRHRCHSRSPSQWPGRPHFKQPRAPVRPNCRTAPRRDTLPRPIDPLVRSTTCHSNISRKRAGQPRSCNEEPTASSKSQHRLTLAASADRPTTSIKPAVSSLYFRPAHLVGDPVLDAINAELLKLRAAYQRMKGERQVPATHPSSAITQRNGNLSNVDEPAAATTYMSPVKASSPSVVTSYDKERHSSFHKASTDRPTHTNLLPNERNGARPQSECFKSGNLQSSPIPVNVSTALSVCETTSNNLCYFHHRFGDITRNCHQPCSWNPAKSRSTNTDRSSSLPKAHNHVPAQMPLQTSSSDNIPPVSNRTLAEPSQWLHGNSPDFDCP